MVGKGREEERSRMRSMTLRSPEVRTEKGSSPGGLGAWQEKACKEGRGGKPPTRDYRTAGGQLRTSGLLPWRWLVGKLDQ